MQHFYVWRFNRWKRWLLIVILALFTATFLYAERDSALSIMSNGNDVTALTKGDTNKKDIALTFDISWGEEKAFDILKQLRQEKVMATFFVSGEWAERHPQIIKDIEKDKHEIGMLGYTYKSYLDQDLQQVKKDMLNAKRAFDKLGFKDTKIIRTPSGQFNKDILKLADNLGLKLIHWSVNPNDWKNPGTKQISNFVIHKTSGGDIILLHASDSVKQTAKALKTIIPELKKKGFHFVSISELMNQAHTKTELID